MKTNLKQMLINGNIEYVAIHGGAECLTPYRDEDNLPIIGWATIVQRIGEEHMCGVMIDPPTHKIVDRANVDINHVCWDSEYYKRKHRGRRSNSNNKKRLRLAEAKRRAAEPVDDELPF